MFARSRSYGRPSASPSNHNVGYAVVARAPIEEIEVVRKRMDWKFLWVSSSAPTSTMTSMSRSSRRMSPPGARSTIFGPRRNGQPMIQDLSGRSVFYKNEAGEIFPRLLGVRRGGEEALGIYGTFDATPKGRDETGPYHLRRVGRARATCTGKAARWRLEQAAPRAVLRLLGAVPQLKPDCAGDGDDEVQQGDNGRGVGPEAAGRGGPRDPRTKGYSAARVEDIYTSAGRLAKGCVLHQFRSSAEPTASTAAEHPASSKRSPSPLNALRGEETTMTEQKITPCLWFDSNAEEAVAHLSLDLSEQQHSVDGALRRVGSKPERRGHGSVFFRSNSQQYLGGGEGKLLNTSSRPLFHSW